VVAKEQGGFGQFEPLQRQKSAIFGVYIVPKVVPISMMRKLSAPQVSGTTKTKFWVRQNSPEDEIILPMPGQ
jgi:hypothetical protein